MEQDTIQPQSSAMPEMASVPVQPVEPVKPINAMPQMSPAPVEPVAPVEPLNAMPEMRAASEAASDVVPDPVAFDAQPATPSYDSPVETMPVPESVVTDVPAAPSVEPSELVPDSALTFNPAAEQATAVMGEVSGDALSDPSMNAGSVPPIPASAIYQSGSSAPLGATDPIMMPELAPEPDPIEEELKAPFKAAEPVPGSIGSAISVPSGDGNAAPEANVSEMTFGTPDTAANTAAPATKKQKALGGKPANKNSLIILTAIAGVVVVVLAVVLIMMLNK